MHHQHLSIAVRASPDADGGHGERSRDRRSDLLWHAFEDDGTRAGMGRGLRIGHQPVDVPLHAVAAELVHGLRAEADVPHHRNAGGRDPGDHVRLTGGTLELHGLTAGLLEDPRTRLDRRSHAQMLQREWQVNDNHRPRHGAGDDLAVVDHLVERGGNGGGPTGNNHRHAVSHEHAVHACGIGQLAGRPVVGRDHRAWTAVAFGGREIENGHTASGVGHGG